MLHCSQDHLQRKLLVPPVRAQPTVTASLRCTSTVAIAMQRYVDRWAQTPDHRTKEQHKPVLSQNGNGGGGGGGVCGVGGREGRCVCVGVGEEKRGWWWWWWWFWRAT